MICSNCGTQNQASAKFCESCGTSLASGCPNCGTQNSPNARFCRECGTTLTPGAAVAAAPVAAFAATPPAPATSERKLVTVLFADLVGFTPFAEERDAEDVRDTLTRYFDLCRDVIGRYGGTIEKFIGDAVMAVWGAPQIREEDAELAVRAAIELIEQVPSLGPNIQARAGVLTGEAAVTIGATDQGMVAGDIVNTASRLQSVAPPGTVLVGESTHRAAAAAIAFEPAGEQMLKGKQAPVAAWRAIRVVGERGGRNRTEALEAPFVGRQEELRLLKELFHSTGREKRLRVVSVVGPAGIGKSRLSWEFSKYLDGLIETMYWHRGRSPAYGEGISFWALGEMIRERCGLAENDDEQTTRAKVRQQIETWVTDPDERTWIERALLTLLGVESGMAADQLFGAWRTFFERIAEKGTVVLLFEDMHFADTGLLDFIDHLLDWSRGLPIYVVTLARPDLIDRRPSWGAGKRNFVSIYLEPLSESDMRELLAGLVPGLPERAASAIVARADGIPLYAVETVRTLVADGRLVERDGRYEPAGDLTNLAVPETLTALIAARLDSLDETDRRIVHEAAVLGQSFTADSLAAVMEQPEADLEPRLNGLVRRELLRREMDPRSPERGQFEFVQALIREVAYNTLSKKDRKKLHLAAARYFESIGSDEIAGALATHYLAAHGNASEPAEEEALASQARIALKAAAARAESLGSFNQAVTFIDQALTVTADKREQAELLLQAANDATVASRAADAEQFLRRAMEESARAGDIDLRARAIQELALSLMYQYKAPEALAMLEPALAEFSDVSEEQKAWLQLTLGRLHHGMKDEDKAYAIAEQVLAIAERHDYTRMMVSALILRTDALWFFGRWRESLAVLEGAKKLAVELGSTDEILRIMNRYANNVSEEDQRAAVEAHREVMAIARRSGRRAELRSTIGSFGYTAFTAGLWDEAVAALEDELNEQMEPRDRIVHINNLANVRVSRGENVDDALDEMLRLEAGMSDAIKMHRLDTLANQQLAHGDYQDSSSSYLDIAKLSPGIGNENYYRAARPRLWAKDLDKAHELENLLLESPGSGKIVVARRQTIAAGIAALEGRSAEAKALYQEAMKGWRDTGAVWDEALTGLDMALLLDPTDPDVSEIVQSTRAVLEGLRAKPYLEMLDRVVARSEPKTISQASDAEVAVPAS